MRRMLFALLLIPALASGCSSDNPYFSDDEGAQRSEGSLLGDHPDELSLPYATGTKVNIELKRTGDGSQLAQWKAESSNTSVLVVKKTVTENNRLVFSCRAAGAGEATLRVLDPQGEEKRKATITVQTPDRARVFSHGALRILGVKATSFDAAEVKEVRVVDKGTAVYAVGYFKGDQHLYGRGILTIEAPPAGVMIQNRTTTGAAANEWFFVVPAGEVSGTLKLSSAGVELASLPFNSVNASAVTSLAIAQEAAEQKKDQEDVWVRASGVDAMGRTVEGVYSTWTVGGVAQVGKDNDTMKTSGDLLRFTLLASATPRDAVATFGAVTAKTSIRADKSWVMDTTYLGCSTGGRSAGAPSVLAAFALVGLALTLRRRRA